MSPKKDTHESVKSTTATGEEFKGFTDSAQKFNTRYAAFGFSDKGGMAWPIPPCDSTAAVVPARSGISFRPSMAGR